MSHPVSPPPLSPPPPVPEKGDSTGGIIPYKNPHALASYYFGVFSVIPVLGFIAACIAIPLGISGLRKRKQRPIIRGAVHAWFGIIVGGCSAAVHLALIGMAIYGISRAR